MSAVPSIPEDTPVVATNGEKKKQPLALQDAANVENFRPLKVIIIGAGYSGIYHGIRIPERLRNVELVIYEKNAGVGGTWWENRYAPHPQKLGSSYVGQQAKANPHPPSDTWVAHAMCPVGSLCISEAPLVNRACSPLVPVQFRAEQRLVVVVRSRSGNPSLPGKSGYEVLRGPLHKAVARNHRVPVGRCHREMERYREESPHWRDDTRPV